MIASVTLEAVSRDDVDNVGQWLMDEDVSSSWFGHYACGDPVHRGYDPQQMVESSDWEWQRVFGDTKRSILSIYSETKEHLGESQILLDSSSGAELSVLIGRKDLWHHGYGTSAVHAMLEQVFTVLKMDRAWVAIPEDNEAALGLFEKIGFTRDGMRDLCMKADGSTWSAYVFTMNATSYKSFHPTDVSTKQVSSAVSVIGLPGSGAEAIGEEIARLLGCTYVNDQMVDLIAKRIHCSPNEVRAFEASYHSIWSRVFNSLTIPMEWSSGYDAGYHLFHSELGDRIVERQIITRQNYREAVAGVVKEKCSEGNVVLHGHGSHFYLPESVNTFTVFVESSPESRAKRIALELGITLKEAMDWLKNADKEARAQAKFLHGADLESITWFDITLNADRISAETAAQTVQGGLQPHSIASSTNALDLVLPRS